MASFHFDKLSQQVRKLEDKDSRFGCVVPTDAPKHSSGIAYRRGSNSYFYKVFHIYTGDKNLIKLGRNPF